MRISTAYQIAPLTERVVKLKEKFKTVLAPKPAPVQEAPVKIPVAKPSSINKGVLEKRSEEPELSEEEYESMSEDEETKPRKKRRNEEQIQQTSDKENNNESANDKTYHKKLIEDTSEGEVPVKPKKKEPVIFSKKPPKTETGEESITQSLTTLKNAQSKKRKAPSATPKPKKQPKQTLLSGM